MKPFRVMDFIVLRDKDSLDAAERLEIFPAFFQPQGKTGCTQGVSVHGTITDDRDGDQSIVTGITSL